MVRFPSSKSKAVLRAPEHSAARELDLHLAITSDGANWRERAFDEFHGLVHGLLLKTLGPRAEIPDLVGDVFVMFFSNAHRIRLASAVRSYMVSITMNVARREARRRRRREFFQALIGSPRDCDQEPGPDDPKAKAALIQLSRIVDELAPDERAAFVLHNLEHMVMSEIASTLGVSQSTAKRRVRSANEHVLKRVGRNALLADYVITRAESSNAE
ncbi:MAG TPA: sigma-70 family RNA polymerase sigma factor [Polyangiaceae bacterium]|nr:sigma-70 family RNA polymerase sigma factor [Polyangiaceae bacterium]